MISRLLVAATILLFSQPVLAGSPTKRATVDWLNSKTSWTSPTTSSVVDNVRYITEKSLRFGHKRKTCLARFTHRTRRLERGQQHTTTYEYVHDLAKASPMSVTTTMFGSGAQTRINVSFKSRATCSMSWEFSSGSTGAESCESQVVETTITLGSAQSVRARARRYVTALKHLVSLCSGKSTREPF